MKNKKKILIVENLMHFWQVDDIYKIFSKNFNCNIILPKKFAHISSLKNNVITSRLRYFMYIHVLLIGRKYDYIYLCTSPEYPDYPNNLKNTFIFFQQLIFFFILIVFFKKKIICYLRGLHRIFPDVHENYFIKFFINIRYRIFKLLDIFVCENKNLTMIFKQKFKNKKIKITTIYTRYFDKKIFYKKKYHQHLVIGVLGRIDPFRKNYQILHENLYSCKAKIKIKFLGGCYKSLSEKVIEDFKDFNIDFKSRMLNEKEFLKMGQDCDLLVSLNREEKHYGQYKGTGSFGDAMYLQKTLIAPSFADPIKEFEDFCHYYNNEAEFKHIFEKILAKQIKLNPKFDKFEMINCSKKIIKDLNI